MTLWTKCADRMPPDDESTVIVRMFDNRCLSKRIAYKFNAFPPMNKDKYVWTKYTHELWKELNNA